MKHDSEAEAVLDNAFSSVSVQAGAFSPHRPHSHRCDDVETTPNGR